MKIIINTATTFKGGGVQVARSFIEECRNFEDHEYHVILGTMISNLVESCNYPSNFTFSTIGYRPATRVLKLQSIDSDFKSIEDRIKPDVVFTTSGPAYWRPKAPHLVGFNRAHYLYWDSPFYSQIPQHKRLQWYLRGAVLKYFFKRDSDAFVVQTDDVNKRLRHWLQTDEVYTVSNTFSRHYDSPKTVTTKLPGKKAGEYRFLILSAWYAHKNLSIVPKVTDLLPDRLKNRVKFVLTLPDDVYHSNFAAASNGSIVNVGPVNPDEGPALYKECDAIFLPTLLECFTATYAEAMKMGKPIVTSDLSFAHTICGDAALYANPVNPHEIANKIIELVENPLLQQELMQKGINRQKTFVTARQRTEEYLKICKRLADAG